jgi:hypothetical protein
MQRNRTEQTCRTTRAQGAFLFLACLLLGCHEPYHTDRALLGRTDSAIIARYDAPDWDTTFALTESLHEYRYGLLALYPDVAERTIVIREMFWVRDDSTNVAVWFERREGRWVVVDNLIWERDKVQF